MSDSTILALNGIGIPDWSARGITQTLEPIAQAGDLRRTVNGGLVDLSDPAFAKYASTISCSDMDSPALEGIWPGATVVVDCIAELCHPTMTGAAAREMVDGSEREAGAFTFYRPRLTMMVESYSISTDEYGAAVGWSIGLLEV